MAIFQQNLPASVRFGPPAAPENRGVPATDRRPYLVTVPSTQTRNLHPTNRRHHQSVSRPLSPRIRGRTPHRRDSLALSPFAGFESSPSFSPQLRHPQNFGTSPKCGLSR